MPKIKVVNIKCGGCAAGIKEALKKEGLKNIDVDVANQTVSFDGNSKVATKKLAQMGYPEAGSKRAKSITKKAKSFLSCAIGKTKK